MSLGTKCPWAQNVPGHKIDFWGTESPFQTLNLWAQNLPGTKQLFVGTKSLGTESPRHKIGNTNFVFFTGHKISPGTKCPRHKIVNQAQDVLGTKCPRHRISHLGTECPGTKSQAENRGHRISGHKIRHIPSSTELISPFLQVL